ncbi:MAG: glycosyltransferase [bacterium]|nr:glycosyltransferase [bacterium]
MDSIITVVLLSSAALYSFRIAFFWIGFLRHGRMLRATTNALPRVTVVVPARDEEHNIERCLRSLEASDYPLDLLQIVVVDDRSSDGTLAILQRFATTMPTLLVLSKTEGDAHPNLKGKPGALQFGFDHATGDVLLMTDADCKVHPQWIRAMAAPHIDKAVGLSLGFTTIRSETFLENVQDVEWVFSQALARGGVGNGVPLGCFGNNMCIRRTVYEDLGGYENIAFSITEDLALLQAVHEAGWKVKYLCEPEATVETIPCTTMLEYIRQRHRWARGGLQLGHTALFFVFTTVALWSGLGLALITANWFGFVALVALRIAGDFGMVAMAAERINRRSLYRYAVPAFCLIFLTEISLPFLVLKKRIVWKGQTFKPS